VYFNIDKSFNRVFIEELLFAVYILFENIVLSLTRAREKYLLIAS